MDNKVPDGLITNPQTVLCAGMFNGPRLTPTGKISHAKTRVYTQRYRKEWEQMPDFRGWLTSVPFQATRAFCTYCNKNLHAHRLSLLKHTCTMKHQRAALNQQNEMISKQAAAAKISEIETSYTAEGDNDGVVHIVEKESNREVEEDNEEFEYVVERLDIDEDYIEEARCKRGEEEDAEQEDVEDYEEVSLEQASLDEDDPMPVNKKIKVERQDENCRDALAEAMAHVQGEYLDGTDDHGDVDLEMVVTSEDGVIEESGHDASMTIIADHGIEMNDPEDAKQMSNKSSAEGDSSEGGSESEVSPGRLCKIEQSYQHMNSGLKTSTMTAAGSSFQALPSSSGQTKTFQLATGKTVTIRPGTQYVLGNIKNNNIPALLMAKRKHGTPGEVLIKTERNVNKGAQQKNAAVAGTSQQSPSQKSPAKTEANKKPCISTHVMDMSKGLPVGGLQVSLYKLMDGRWTFLNESNTSPNGRCADLVDSSKCNFTAGRYKMHFDVDKYFTLRRIETMYPFIEIVFDVKNPTGNYHIPVLLSPFGYTTYRGADS